MVRLKPQPETAGFNVRTIAIVLVAWVVALGFGFHYFFGSEAGVEGMGKIERHELDATFGQGSTGIERKAILMEATRDYVAAHPDAPRAMAEGRELAPEDFLNQELERRHARFRVRDVQGMMLNIYEVS